MAAISPDRSRGDPNKEEKKVGDHEVGSGGVTGVLEPQDMRNADGSSINSASDILALQDMDPVMNMKMHLVNNVSASGFGGFFPEASSPPPAYVASTDRGRWAKGH